MMVRRGRSLFFSAAVWLAQFRSISGEVPFAGDFPTAGLKGARIRAVSWNVAAVNNNPFEYWITHPNPKYKELMNAVEQFVMEPGDEDVRVDEVFTDAMFKRLMKHMKKVKNMSTNLETVQTMWDNDYRSRRVVSQFLQDGELGKKRLASMPDRVTNTIQQADKLVFRPTVINCYEGEMGTIDEWFEQWLEFFFKQKVKVNQQEKPRLTHTMLQPIKQAKYPAITLEEEAASIPLQLVLLGVFDAILMKLMRTKGGDLWEDLRRDICVSLNSKKNDRINEILGTTYKNADVIFLQEAGNKLVEKLSYKSEYMLMVSQQWNAQRNQNSVMLLRNDVFTNAFEVRLDVDGIETGDLLVLEAVVKVKNNKTMAITLASFHGDTNGLLTIPVAEAIAKKLPNDRLLFGLDANTHEKRVEGKAHVSDFEEVYTKLGWEGIWGKVKPYTTFNARTYLQPQLNKAARSTKLAEEGDRNPKDHLLFTKGDFSVGTTWRDNTGQAKYLEDTVFPTLDFPSDHAIISADLFFLPPTKAQKKLKGKGGIASSARQEAGLEQWYEKSEDPKIKKVELEDPKIKKEEL